MRPKVVLSACVLAFLILAPALYFHFAPSSPTAGQPAPATDQVAAAPQPVAAPAVVPQHRRIAAPANVDGVSTPDPAGTDHDQFISTRTAELTQLGASDDPADLKTILTELNNKEPALRKAALDAAVQFGSKDAIPALQNEMSWTEDPQEKVDLQNAIKYLELPTFDQFTANLAARQTSPSPASN